MKIRVYAQKIERETPDAVDLHHAYRQDDVSAICNSKPPNHESLLEAGARTFDLSQGCAARMPFERKGKTRKARERFVFISSARRNTIC